jgi:hypothetical protein
MWACRACYACDTWCVRCNTENVTCRAFSTRYGIHAVLQARDHRDDSSHAVGVSLPLAQQEGNFALHRSLALCIQLSNTRWAVLVLPFQLDWCACQVNEYREPITGSFMSERFALYRVRVSAMCDELNILRHTKMRGSTWRTKAEVKALWRLRH